MKYYCLIPARGGSKGLPGKNIRPLAGKPLISHSIICAKQAGIFDDIYVSTDDNEIAEVARSFGANVPFIRDSTLGQDNTHMFKVYKEFVQRLSSIDDTSVLMVLLPTNPLRTKEDIFLVKNIYEKDNQVDWVFTCNECEHHPFRSIRINQQTSDLEPFFPIENNVMWSNRQELPTAYRFNGAIISGKVSQIRNYNEYPIDSYIYMNTNVKGVISSDLSRLDIDTRLDFDFIEYILSNQNLS